MYLYVGTKFAQDTAIYGRSQKENVVQYNNCYNFMEHNVKFACSLVHYAL